MAHKMSWLMFFAFAAGGIAGGYLMRGRAPATAADPAVLQRLERLEAAAPQAKRELARAGAQMGVMALSAAAAAGSKADPEGGEAGAAAGVTAAERAAKERAHYDRLDQLVRTGGGVKAAAHLRKNIEEARAKKTKGGALDVASLDCSDALCRVEVRGSGNVAAISSAGLQAFSPGMGPLTMRPYEKGRPLVFYLAAPGQDLPPFDF